MFHPWRALRALAHVTLVWHEGGPAGWTHFPTATISLRRGMTLAERRSTIAHDWGTEPDGEEHGKTVWFELTTLGARAG